MNHTNTEFEKAFQELNNTFTMRNPQKVHDFIEKTMD